MKLENTQRFFARWLILFILCLQLRRFFIFRWYDLYVCILMICIMCVITPVLFHCFSTVLQVEVQVVAMMMRVLVDEIR